MDARFYSTREWRALREQARERDGRRCTVARLLGGRCSSVLHGHHLDPDGDPLDLDNVITACARHHPQVESIRRAVLAKRRAWGPPRCPHRHRTPEARAICERRLARLHASAR